MLFDVVIICYLLLAKTFILTTTDRNSHEMRIYEVFQGRFRFLEICRLTHKV